MNSIDKGAILELERNPSSLYVEGIAILIKLLENVIREPENVKYRTIRTANKIIKEKLLCLSNIDAVLKCIGFELVRHELAHTYIDSNKHYRIIAFAGILFPLMLFCGVR